MMVPVRLSVSLNVFLKGTSLPSNEIWYSQALKPFPMWQPLLSIVPEIARSLGTALAIRAGRSICPDLHCSPSLVCPRCPDLTCHSVPDRGSHLGWYSYLVVLVIGIAIGCGACYAGRFGTFALRTSSSPKKSAARIALERS